MNTTLLQTLLHTHATPGDEHEIAELLAAAWQRSGLATRHLGARAVYADSAPRSRKPVLLIAAHMDACGFAVDRFLARGFGLTALGYPSVTKASTPAVLKTRAGLVEGTVRRTLHEGSPSTFSFHPKSKTCLDVRHGDRVAFAPSFARDGQTIASPFLDNRLGCWVLTLLAPMLRTWTSPYRIVLGATSSEEMCGHGAPALAHELRPHATLILDTTYANPDQRVKCGKGPVLTLSDASTLLSLNVRDHFIDLFKNASLPLQTEVYNFSGTDAKAFPLAGLPGPVVPLLLPTTGNHSALETAHLDDVDTLLRALPLIVARKIPN